MSNEPIRYMRIRKSPSPAITVTEKAYEAIYRGKGFSVEAADVAPEPDPVEVPAVDEDAPSPELLEVRRVLRGTIAEVIQWAQGGATPEEVAARAQRAFLAESDARGRTGLLDALAKMAQGETVDAAGVTSPAPPDGGDDE